MVDKKSLGHTVHVVIHSSFILSSYFGCSLFQRSKSGKSQDKEKPVVAFLQPFCGFQHILEGPEVNCGDFECDLDAILNMLLVVKIRRLPEMVIEWGRTKKGKLTMIDLIGQNWR